MTAPRAENDTAATAAAAAPGSGDVRLTATRQRILEILTASDRPLGAYDLIRAIAETSDRPVRPPTVYRALDFMTRVGLVRRIESRNAFVACARPERAEAIAFFLCNRCGVAAEFEDSEIDRLLAKDASVLGFRLTRRVLEVEGTCRTCDAAVTGARAS